MPNMIQYPFYLVIAKAGMYMFKNKFKAYKFTILMSILSLILLVINYFSSPTQLNLIVLLITIITCLILIIGYWTEKKRQ